MNKWKSQRLYARLAITMHLWRGWRLEIFHDTETLRSGTCMDCICVWNNFCNRARISIDSWLYISSAKNTTSRLSHDVFPITPLSMTILILRERRPNKKHNSAVAWIAHFGLSVEMAATKNISFFVGAPPSMIFAASAPNAGTTKSTFPWTDANYSLIFKTLECRHESRLTI
jgi:hypothetical protein